MGTRASVRVDAAPGGVRVMFVIYGLAVAGPELRILHFARNFPENADIHVCVIGDDLALLDEFRRTRAKLLIVPMERPYLEWRRLATVLAYIRDHEIAVVNTFNLKTLLVGAVAKLRFGSRIKLIHHVISMWEDVRLFHRAAIWAMVRLVDRVVCNGQAVKERVIGARQLAAPVSVIPNGVDCEHFKPSPALRASTRDRLGFAGGDFVLGTVANVRPVKNYPFLLHAMKRIAASHPHVRLLCVGGGAQLEDMKALARSLGLADSVQFTGLVKDVRPFLAAMDAFVLCSSMEGNPNVVLQAMAMAVPVISTSVGEVPHLIQHGVSGLLFAPGDEAAFVASVGRLAGDDRYRQALAESAWGRAKWTYSLPQMIAGYAALMHDATAA
jgi:glycosyltransferase involved in cell wall biosynthesis